jgi:hypothetical protein
VSGDAVKGAADRPSDVVYATQGLVETLLRLAREEDPDSVTISLSVTPAGDLPAADIEDDDLPPDTPVFTHFYLPETGGSVNAVFGMDLGTPAGQTEGRFVSHPLGDLSVSKTDDLHEVVFVAIPPWDTDSIAAFDRSNNRQPLRLLDVEPPEEYPA